MAVVGAVGGAVSSLVLRSRAAERLVLGRLDKVVRKKYVQRSKYIEAVCMYNLL